jgi:hypothetical protein
MHATPPRTKLMVGLLELKEQFLARCRKSDSLGHHCGEKGQRRENALAEILSEFLPRKYRIGTGEIVASTGAVSGQCDILIFDSFFSPVLDDAQHSQIVPAESVYSVIELKPNMTADDLRRGLDGVRKAKQLPRDAISETHGGHHIYHGERRNPSLFGAILAYGDTISPERARDITIEHCEGWPQRDRPDQIPLIDKGLMCYASSKNGGVTIFHPESKECPPTPSLLRTGEDTFGFFLLELLHNINRMDLFPPDLQRYR